MFSLIFFFLMVHWPYTSSIIGGFRASSQPPATGIVLIDNGFNLKHPPFCTGVLISNRMVLANGNCCRSPPLNRTRIFMGSTKPFSGGQFYYVDDYRLFGVATYPIYKLCVLRLDREVEFSEYVQPIALPSKADAMVCNDKDIAYAFGYGSVHLDREDKKQNPIFQRVLSSELMAIFMPLLANTDCEKFFGRHPVGNWKLLCMGFTTDRTRRLMLDDNGAPVVGKRDRIVFAIGTTYSVLSGRYNWDKDSFPFYFIDVASARDDISRAIRQMYG